MRWWIYNVVFSIVYMAMMPKFLHRMRKRGGYRANFSQRFGTYSPDVLERLRERPRLWIHAVSVGESLAADLLLKELRKQCPGLAVVLSTTSSTGYKICEGIVGADDVLIYFPLDFPWMVRRALDAVRPTHLILIESELWPNMVRQCLARDIPVMLANGRISDRSATWYRLGRFFLRPLLSRYEMLLVQYEIDRKRLLAVGAPTERIVVTGTAKFDVEPPPDELVAGARAFLSSHNATPHCTLLGASTWSGEEQLLLDAYAALRPRVPGLRLVLVPRHKERGDDVEALIRNAGFECVRRSKISLALGTMPPRATPPQEGNGVVYLADTTGELLAFHAAADIVFVGKSLAPGVVGGQNMIEPVALGKAVVVGPHTENFSGAMDILREADALCEVANGRELAETLERLATDPQRCHAIGQRGIAVVNRQRGAARRMASEIARRLKG